MPKMIQAAENSDTAKLARGFEVTSAAAESSMQRSYTTQQ